MAAQIEELQYRLRGIDQLSAPAKKAEQSLKSLGNQAKRSSIQMNQFGGSFTGVGKDMRKFALGGLQQAGYQIGDFAVQVANGTSKMQAFGQQAPQLLQIFGPVGAVIGAGVAIFAAFGVALEKANSAAKGTTDAIKSIAEETKSAKEEISMLMMALASVEQVPLMKEINASKAEIISLQQKITDLELEQVEAGETRSAQIDKHIASYQRAIDRQQKIVSTNQKIIDEQNKTNDLLEKTREQYDFIIGSEEGLQAATAVLNEQFASRLGTIDNTANNYIDILGSEAGLSTAVAANNKLYADRLGTIDRVANSYVDVLGSEKGLSAATNALNSMFANRLGTIDDTANKYVDILGSEDGLKASVNAINSLFESRLGTIDDTANKYVDILGSEDGLTASIMANNSLYEDRLAIRAAEIALNRQNFINEPSVDVAAEKLDKLREKWEKFKSDRDKPAKKGKKIGDPLGDLTARIELNQKLLGATEARRQVQEAIFQSERSYTPQQIANAEKLVSVFEKQKARLDEVKSISQSVGQSFENAFMSAIDGSKSLGDAFRLMAIDIIKELFRIFVVKKITNFIASSIEGAFSIPNVAAPSFAGGGYTGGGARSGGVDGQGGFNAILHPNETVIDHTKGQNAGGVIVQQTINVTTGIQQTVRNEIQTLLPQIAEASKAAVLDARRRGGSFANAF